jgi:maleylacetate reductase
MNTAPIDFVHDQRPLRVVFASGALDALPHEIERLGGKRMAIIAGRRHLERVSGLLGEAIVTVVDDPVMHVPVAQVEQVTAEIDGAGADIVVAIGGGSAIGLAKAVALRTRTAIVAVPGTFSGSEVTRVWGMTDRGVKTTGRDEVVAPRTVIYDPALLDSLPRDTAIPSAFNAIAHAVEALYAPDRTPITDLYAAAGIRALHNAIPALGHHDEDATASALYGAWLCGMCLDATTMGLHHKLCHVLGGTLNLPHAQTHTAVLPHVLAFNGPAITQAGNVLRHTLGAADPANYLRGLAENNGVTMALNKLGMDVNDAGHVADMVLGAPYTNARQPTRADLVALLHRALVGAPAVTNPAESSRVR